MVIFQNSPFSGWKETTSSGNQMMRIKYTTRKRIPSRITAQRYFLKSIQSSRRKPRMIRGTVKKRGVVGKSAGKVQMQGGEPRSCHTADKAGDSSEIFDGASGKPGNQIVSNPDDKQNFYF